MVITFNPPLGGTTSLALPLAYSCDADVELTFKATFDTPAEAAQLRDGSRIEMWTNLPVPGRSLGEWGALSFVAPPKRDPGSLARHRIRTFAISPDPGTGASEADILRVHLRTRFPSGNSVYSYTYRLVEPDGNIRWLGNYSRDGRFEVERRDSRIEFDPLTTWVTSETGESTWKGASETVIGKLNTELDWSLWVLAEDGSVHQHASLANVPEYIAPSILVLLPSPSPTSLLNQQPLLLLSTVGVAAISVLPTGEIKVSPLDGDEATLSLRTFDGTWDARDVLSSAPGTRNARLVSLHPELGYAVFASPPNLAPVTVSLIPLTTPGNTSARPSLISPRTLASLLPAGTSPGVTLYAPVTGRLLVIPSADAEKADAPLLISAGRRGGQFFVAPTHILKSTIIPLEVSVLGVHELLPTVASEAPEAHLPSPPLTPPRAESPQPAVASPTIQSPTPRFSPFAPFDSVKSQLHRARSDFVDRLPTWPTRPAFPALPTLPHPTLSIPTLPVPTLPRPTLLIPTLPFPTLPHPTLPLPTLPTLPTLPRPSLPQPFATFSPFTPFNTVKSQVHRAGSDFVGKLPVVGSLTSRPRGPPNKAAVHVSDPETTETEVESDSTLVAVRPTQRPSLPQAVGDILRDTLKQMLRQPLHPLVLRVWVRQFMRTSVLLFILVLSRMLGRTPPGFLPSPPGSPRGRTRSAPRRSVSRGSSADTRVNSPDHTRKVLPPVPEEEYKVPPEPLSFLLGAGPALLLVRSLARAKPADIVSVLQLELDGGPVTAAWRPLDDGVVLKLDTLDRDAQLKVALPL